MQSLNSLVRITDVAPRDGLQNEARPIPTAQKIELIRLLSLTGVDEIEVSSFVSPKWIPQLGDAAEVFQTVAAFKPAGMMFSALVPNDRGLDAALRINQELGRPVIDKVSVFTAASETFAMRNTNATIAETLDRFRPVFERAHAAGLTCRGYVSCAIQCPFEGPISPVAAAQVAATLLEIGADELDMADTIGVATPQTTRALLEALSAAVGPQRFAESTLHLHDTFGGAAACVREALSLGIRSFDASAGGLGGCPYASTPGKRAPGNIATLTLLGAIQAQAMTTHVAPEALLTASAYARKIVGMD